MFSLRSGLRLFLIGSTSLSVGIAFDKRKHLFANSYKMEVPHLYPFLNFSLISPHYHEEVIGIHRFFIKVHLLAAAGLCNRIGLNIPTRHPFSRRSSVPSQNIFENFKF